MTIRILPESTVNRIAAGEVVERPAAVVKELMENAIDAGASSIEVVLRDGGQSYISVTDDGEGMTPGELAMAVERHATSKLPEDDLVNITTLGFRGEALASIGAVSRLSIESRKLRAPEEHGWAISVEGGVKSEVRPSPIRAGTRVEVRDLFYATPARLKFLRQARTEFDQAHLVVRRLAMSRPGLAFKLQDNERVVIDIDAATGDLWDPRFGRLAQVVGSEFADNAIAVYAERENVHVLGYIGVPTFNRATNQHQYLFVNDRPVSDRQLITAVRAAYLDVMPHDRHAVVALYLYMPSDMVDVNVHPTKAEVRFREVGLVRGLVVGAIKHSLARAGHRTATTVSAAALAAARVEAARPGGLQAEHHGGPYPRGMAEREAATLAGFGEFAPGGAPEAEPAAHQEAADAARYPLGAARAQLHGNYIVAQTADGLVIVDQHAAHERLVYEHVKEALAEGGVQRQGLLIPEVVELDEPAANALLAHAEELARLGLVVEAFGPGVVAVRDVPALLGQVDVAGLVRDLADQVREIGAGRALAERLEAVCARMACHGSVRSGRRLSVEEMNGLLREMEATPNAGQCGHGRPTYVELKLNDIEKLFGRR